MLLGTPITSPHSKIEGSLHDKLNPETVAAARREYDESLRLLRLSERSVYGDRAIFL